MKVIAIHKRYTYMGDRDELVDELHEVETGESVTEFVERLLVRTTTATMHKVAHPHEWIELRLVAPPGSDWP